MKGLVKISKNLLSNLIGNVPKDVYDICQENWEKNYFFKVMGGLDISPDKIMEMWENRIGLGIDLNEIQLKVLMAILIALTKYDYKPNTEEGVFRIGLKDLLDNYHYDGDVRGNIRKHFLKGLKELSLQRNVLKYMIKDENNNLVEIREVENLYSFSTKIIMGKKFIFFKFHRIFMERIDNYFVQVPNNITKELMSEKAKEGFKVKRISKFELYLQLYLLSQLSIKRQKSIQLGRRVMKDEKHKMALMSCYTCIKTNFLKLAIQIRMMSYIKKSHWSAIRQKIRCFLNRAQKLGYIKNFQEDKANDEIIINLKTDGVFKNLSGDSQVVDE